MKKIDRTCQDYCQTVIVYSPVDAPNSPEKGPKRRSLLQAPKSYSSKLPAPSKTLTSEDTTPRTQPIPIPQSSPSQTSIPEQVETQEFFIGDRVRIGGIKTGTLLYFGPTHIASGLWCGIALDEADGIHDGLVNDVRYFTCRKGHGIFAPAERVSHLDTKAPPIVSQIVKSPPKVSQVISSKSKFSHSEAKPDEVGLDDRIDEIGEAHDQAIDGIEGLDENGIIHDTDEEEAEKEKHVPKRKLPKLPRGSHGFTKLQYMKQCIKQEIATHLGASKVSDNILDQTVEKLSEQLRMISEDDIEGVEGNRTFSLEDKCDSIELQHSAGGSSGGEDSWSLSKDYLAMCDGKQTYLNITFDGETESKGSTKEPSEESPSPEFIFDQEMMEDGEFASEPMDMSRDSSLGILSSIVLEQTDLLYDLVDVGDVHDLESSNETLEATSDKIVTPEKQEVGNNSVDFDEAVLSASTPFIDNVKGDNNGNISETDMNDSSQTGENMQTNTTFTKDDLHPESSQCNTGNPQNMNGTFTMSEKIETKVLGEKFASVHGSIIESEKCPMVDSGISLRGSMTESGIAGMSLRGSMTDSGALGKGIMVDSSVKGKMVDSGITVQNVMLQSNGISQEASVGTGLKGVDNEMKGVSNVCNTDVTIDKGSDGIAGGKELSIVSEGDKQLMSDLKDGHHRKERPISFLSTTSADTGYVPDTDSEVGTLTLNSPQEWMDKGYHGNSWPSDMPPGVQRNLMHDFKGEKVTRLVPVPVESDSDVGTMTGDTDTEDRPEIVQPVQACETLLSGVVMETGVTMDTGRIEEESEDEVTQIEGLNETITLENNDKLDDNEDEKQDLNSTFTLPEDENIKPEAETSCDTTESLSIVTVVITDKEDEENEKESSVNTEKKNEKLEKAKQAKKKKFNVVKDFKKPNTNVVSKLSEYLKAPLPTKPKDDKANTEEAKNKRNLSKGKIDVSKVTSKLDIKNVADDKNNKNEKKEEIIEKEPVKKVKRTPPKSKWGAIMSQIDNKKDEEKAKPKPEVKSKLEAFLHIPPPAPVKKEEPKPKLKKRISAAIPDYSKVQSKLKYSAPPPTPKPKKEDEENSPKKEKAGQKKEKVIPSKKKPVSSNNNRVPSKSPNRSVSESPTRKIRDSKNGSPARSPIRNGDEPSRSRKLSKDLAKVDRARNISGDSVKRPEVRDKMLHIDLADSLDGRGSVTGTGSVLSSRPGSTTGVSESEADEEANNNAKVATKKLVKKSVSLSSERRDSTSAVSEISESGSQVFSREVEIKMKNASANQQRRKSSLVLPSNLVANKISGGGGGSRTAVAAAGGGSGGGAVVAAGGGRSGGPKIVKPVLRQHSAPNPKTSSSSTMLKHSLLSNKAPPEKSKRPRNQNRNKTSKVKKEAKEKVRPPETVLAEDHTREVQRLEALCETRTKQLNMVKLQLQTSNGAFDGMASTVNYLANDLDGFSCPRLRREIETLKTKVAADQAEIDTLNEKKDSLEGIILSLKDQHKDYLDSLQNENEKSLQYQRENLVEERKEELNRAENRRVTELSAQKENHECQLMKLRQEHATMMEKQNITHFEEIKILQNSQDSQMEELHKQHQDKLEDITNRFDGIKFTLSEKVESLRCECDRLRDRARCCEDALQRDSDYKVQCALAPYKDLPQEIESLKTVLEMRNDEINKLRNQNVELQKKLEELPVAQEKIIGLQQKKENLEAIISMKTDHEKTLHERCQNLMKKYDKESRANKRLSMDYEELMWKLSETFSDTVEMSDQEQQFYQKLGMSPTSSEDTHGMVTRRLHSVGSESSPSKSPAYRRSISAIQDDRDDKKFRRRSGNFLLDEKRHGRSTSPLAKQNPLTKSWSPGTQSPSPTRAKNGSPKMSQSWCVEVYDEQSSEQLPKSQSDHIGDSVRGNPKNGKAVIEEQQMLGDGDAQKVSVSKDSLLSARLMAGGEVSPDATDSVRLEQGGITVDRRQSGSSTHSTGEGDVFTGGDNVDRVSELSQQNGHTSKCNVSSNSVEDKVPINIDKDDAADLPKATVVCPPSKIPTKFAESDRRQQEVKKPVTRSHRESVV